MKHQQQQHKSHKTPSTVTRSNLKYCISGTEHKLTSTTHIPLSSHLSRQGQLLNRVLFAYQNSTLNLSKQLFWNLKQADGDFKVSFRINGSILYICVIKGPILLTPSRESMFHRWGHFCCHLSGGLLKTSRLWNDGFRSFCSLRLQKPWYPGFGNKINPFPDVMWPTLVAYSKRTLTNPLA